MANILTLRHCAFPDCSFLQMATPRGGSGGLQAILCSVALWDRTTLLVSPRTQAHTGLAVGYPVLAAVRFSISSAWYPMFTS